MATSVSLKKKMKPAQKARLKMWARKHGKIIVFKDGEVFDGRKCSERTEPNGGD